MKSRPILFSAAMVRAILNGSKTQTRRTCKARTQNQADIIGGAIIDDQLTDLDGIGFFEGKAWRNHVVCPYGQPGDTLWVREEHFRFGHWEPVEGVRTKTGRQKWKFVEDSDEVRYLDYPPEEFRKGMHKETPHYRTWHKRLARFMPRSVSRITLEITGIRVERLKEISEHDAMAEGITEDFPEHECNSSRPFAEGYQWLWESINGAGSWDENPFVWVIEFRKVEGGSE